MDVKYNNDRSDTGLNSVEWRFTHPLLGKSSNVQAHLPTGRKRGKINDQASIYSTTVVEKAECVHDDCECAIGRHSLE